MTDVLAARASTAPRRSWVPPLTVAASAAVAGWAIGWISLQVMQGEHPKWLLARVSGISSLVLMTALVTLGLLLAHPRGTVLRSLPRASMIALHVGLATFTGVFVVLHVLVLTLDQYAGVGWSGVLLPLGADYRPVPVTLGWLGLYAGLVAGLTARFAGRVGRAWFPLHKATLAVYAAVWAHGVFAGSDTSALTLWYAGSAVLVVMAAASRYTTRSLRVGSSGGAR